LAAFLETCGDPADNGNGRVQVVDVGARTLLASLPGWAAQELAIAPDGGSFVSQEVRSPAWVGPMMVATMPAGAPVVELQGVCWDDFSLSADGAQQPGCHAFPEEPFPFSAWDVEWSPGGTMIAATDLRGNYPGAYLVVWDARDGHVLFKRPTEAVDGAYPDVYRIIFTPDSKGLDLSLSNGVVERLSTETWTKVARTQLDTSVFGVDALGFVGFTPDGSSILAVGGLNAGGDGSLFWLDAATLQITKTVEHAHSGSPKSMAMSPDGSVMATGASDGILRVWDTKTGELEQQMDFGGSQVQGLAFIDDRHVAVALTGAGLLIMTVDPAELADTVRASLTRTFTGTECSTYRIDPCPTLEQMRAP
jgi:hypothetical protein